MKRCKYQTQILRKRHPTQTGLSKRMPRFHCYIKISLVCSLKPTRTVIGWSQMHSCDWFIWKETTVENKGGRLEPHAVSAPKSLLTQGCYLPEYNGLGQVAQTIMLSGRVDLFELNWQEESHFMAGKDPISYWQFPSLWIRKFTHQYKNPSLGW